MNQDFSIQTDNMVAEEFEFKRELYDYSDIIHIKEPCTLNDGCLLEHFNIIKGKGKDFKISWSLGFGYSEGSHNPGVGRIDEIPMEYFLNNDLLGLSNYLHDRYNKALQITKADILENDDIKALFQLISELKYKAI